MAPTRPILVTGAAGFIGRHVIAALRRAGHPVRAVVRSSEAARELSALGAEVIVADLHDGQATARAARRVAGVYHLAGKLFSPGTDPAEYERLHVEATERLFSACLDSGDPDFFVLCSTTGVHGPTGASPAREDDPGTPQNPYEITKARAEETARQVARQRHARLVIARPGLVYGPGDRHLLGWYRSILNGYYRVMGQGANHLHPIYIDDLVGGLLLCPPHATQDGRAYHLVGSRPFSMRELSDAIGQALGRPVPAAHLPALAAYAAGGLFELLPIPRASLPLSRSRVRFLLQDRRYDGTRARTELGFVPQVELEEGLARTVAWYREHGWL